MDNEIEGLQRYVRQSQDSRDERIEKLNEQIKYLTQKVVDRYPT